MVLSLSLMTKLSLFFYFKESPKIIRLAVMLYAKRFLEVAPTFDFIILSAARRSDAGFHQSDSVARRTIEIQLG